MSLRLNAPLFVAGLVCAALAVGGELAAAWAGTVGSKAGGELAALGAGPPGFGVPLLALLDGLVLFTFGLMGLSLLLPSGLHAKVQGIATLVASLLLVLGGIALVFMILALLILMVSLLLAPIFGTAAYVALYGSFARGRAAGILSALMLLKLAAAACLVFAHPRFLQNKGLVLLLLTSLLAHVITAFLHGFPPLLLVSITDAIAGLISAVLAVVWGLVLLIGSIPAVVKALRVDRDLA